MTPNKGQLSFGENGPNKGIFEIPLFVIFREFREIRDFCPISDKSARFEPIGPFLTNVLSIIQVLWHTQATFMFKMGSFTDIL